MGGKKSTRKSNFYLAILNELKTTTNLGKIKDKLNISKQQLNYYLRELKKNNYIKKNATGWYEVTKSGKNLTKYDTILNKDISRGHANIWTVKLTKKIDNWDKRLDILKQKNINFKLVGAKLSTPRIKVLGRKVWLCNNHLRIFDKKDSSYYGLTAIESRKAAFNELLLIVGALERKLGVFLKPFEWEFRREHYALIKNDLAIENNRKGVIVRIADEDGEWLLIDDSLGEGGELETIGKKAFQTNVPMQKWWIDHKKHKFQVTPSFLMESIGKVTQNQQVFDANMMSHLEVLENIGLAITELKEEIKKINGKT